MEEKQDMNKIACDLFTSLEDATKKEICALNDLSVCLKELAKEKDSINAMKTFRMINGKN